MAINVSDLPPKYQAQAMKKYMEQQARRGPMPSAVAPQDPEKARKYHNSPTERIAPSGNVLHFDSQKEARRYDTLISLQNQGQIRDLRLQVDFTLQEAYTDPEGRRVRAIRYRADFTYLERVQDDFGCAPNRDVEIATSAQNEPPRNDKFDSAWRKVVEDVKSAATKTRVYEVKKKLLREKFGYEIREV